MVIADIRDYERGYQKHYNAYQLLHKNNDCTISNRLLLVYSVECGLKYQLLRQWRENNPRKILNNSKDIRRKILISHDLKKILKELGQAGSFRFSRTIKTSHGDSVRDDNFHQMCRYGIEAEKESILVENEYEKEFVKIYEWIMKRRM